MGEPPSWEKAAMYVVMCLVVIACGGGLLSLDSQIVAPLVSSLLA
jgi:putative oxidoreductase